MSSKSDTSKQVSPQLLVFYAKMTNKFHEAMIEVFKELDEEAQTTEGAGILVAGQAAGYAFASALFDVTQDVKSPDTLLTEYEKEGFIEVGNAMRQAFEQRVTDMTSMNTSPIKH